MFAVCDRIDVSSLSDAFLYRILSVNVDAQVLSQKDDLPSLKENLAILISRESVIFRKHIVAKAISQHIENEYSSQMSRSSMCNNMECTNNLGCYRYNNNTTQLIRYLINYMCNFNSVHLDIMMKMKTSKTK